DQTLPGLDEASTKIIATTVSDLAGGTVIADFFLPYRVSGDFPGIQYVLPRQAPTFAVNVGCTDAGGNAPVVVDVKGGMAPYEISIDQGAYQALNSPLQLSAGVHSLMLRDAEGG